MNIIFFKRNPIKLILGTAVAMLVLAPASGQKRADAGKEPAGVTSKVQKPANKNATRRDAGVYVKTNTKQVTVVGEVIDAWCYCSGVMGDGRGESHKKCARLCVSGGVTAGILTDDGTVYVAGKYEGYKGCAGLLLPYVATRVKVKGWLAERGGLKILKINSVEPADPKKKS